MSELNGREGDCSRVPQTELASCHVIHMYLHLTMTSYKQYWQVDHIQSPLNDSTQSTSLVNFHQETHMKYTGKVQMDPTFNL